MEKFIPARLLKKISSYHPGDGDWEFTPNGALEMLMDCAPVGADLDFHGRIKVAINKLEQQVEASKPIDQKIVKLEAMLDEIKPGDRNRDVIEQKIEELKDRSFLQGEYEAMVEQERMKERLEQLKKKKAPSHVEAREMQMLESKLKKTISGGMNTGRVEGYTLPDLTEEDLDEIERDRQYLRSLSFPPDDYFEIDINELRREGLYGGSHVDWIKPLKVECYNITKEELIEVGKNAIANQELVKILSYHGASHSQGLLLSALEEGIEFDFIYHANLEMEMNDELEYVKYMVLEVLGDRKLPLVIITRGEDLETIFYEKGAFPTIFRRWCTIFFKIIPYKLLFKYLWYPFIKEVVRYSAGDLRRKEKYLEKCLERYEEIGEFTGGDDSLLSRLDTKRREEGLDPEEKSTRKRLMEKKRISINIQKLPREIELGVKVTDTGRISRTWNGRRLLVLQYLGIQSHQSEGRKNMNPFPTLSEMSTETLLVYEVLPTFIVPEDFKREHAGEYEKAEDFNLILVKEAGAFQNPNERRFGRHGCLICPFSGWEFFQYLKEECPELHERAITLRNKTFEKYFEGKEYEIYRLGKEISETAMEKYEERTGKELTESPF